MTQARTPYLVTVSGRSALHVRDGKKVVSTGTADRGEATAFLVDYMARRGERAARAAGPVTLGDALDAWGRARQEANSKTWRSKWAYLVRRIKSGHGWRVLGEIGPEWAKGYVEERRADGIADPTIRQDLSTILAAFEAARSSGLTKLPVPSLSLPAASEPRAEWLTRNEAEKLIEAATKRHLRLFIRLGLATGGRHEALLQLRWSRVDLERGVVDLRPTRVGGVGGGRMEGEGKRGKEKGRGLVRIEGMVLDELRAARQTSVTDHVVEFAGRPIASVTKAFRSAVDRAGLDPELVTPHVLRHTFATWAVQAGVPLHKVAAALGHTDTKMVEKVYGHHSPDFMTDLSAALAQAR